MINHSAPIQEALQVAYESVRLRADVAPVDFMEYAGRCAVHPVTVGGKVAGAVLVHGAEIHACVDPSVRGRWFDKGAAKILADVVSANGYATTRATTEDGEKFVRRLGFTQQNGAWVKYGH